MDINSLRPNPQQPRAIFAKDSLEELAESIRVRGVLQPILARQVASGFEIIAGERRWRAAKMAGLKRIPVIFSSAHENEMLELALIENIQREDLNPIEEALAFRKLHKEFALSHEEIAKRTGKNRSTITNTIRLLDLPEEVQGFLRDETLSAGHARALLSLGDRSEQILAAKRIMKMNLSVRQAESISRAVRRASPIASDSMDPNVRAAIRAMERSLGMRVKVELKGNGGTLTINFHTKDELHKLYELLSR